MNGKKTGFFWEKSLFNKYAGFRI